jgi:uncharacterized glyoxalase superfamily protein PhnB
MELLIKSALLNVLKCAPSFTKASQSSVFLEQTMNPSPSQTVKPIPSGYASVSASLIVPDVDEALAFYQRALGAVPGDCLRSEDNATALHGEIRIGDSTVMLSPENESWGTKSPVTLGGSPVHLHLYVTDADAAFRRAVQAGCQVLYPMEDAFWGDRYGKVKDPFGHCWGFATRREELSPSEIAQRGHAWMRRMSAAS